MHKPFTAEEDRLIREIWPRPGRQGGAQGAKAQLPDRSLGAIYARANKLQLGRRAYDVHHPDPVPNAQPEALRAQEVAVMGLIEALAERREPLPGAEPFGKRVGLPHRVVTATQGRLVASGQVRFETGSNARRAVLPDGRATGWSSKGGWSAVQVRKSIAPPERPRPRLVTATAPSLPVERPGRPLPSDSARFGALPPNGRKCSWPTWPHAERPSRPTYCEAPAVGAHPYCAGHCATAYIGRQRVA